MNLVITPELRERLKREGFEAKADSYPVSDEQYKFALEFHQSAGSSNPEIEAEMWCLTHPSHGELFKPDTIAKDDPTFPEQLSAARAAVSTQESLKDLVREHFPALREDFHEVRKSSSVSASVASSLTAQMVSFIDAMDKSQLRNALAINSVNNAVLESGDSIQKSIRESQSQVVDALHKVSQIFLYGILGIIGTLLLIAALSLKAHAANGTSRIDVITIQNGGTTVKSFAAPFKFNCSTNMTCSISGSTLSISSTGGGAATGYQTIQNAGVAIAQETVLNWTAGIVCVDNAGATRSDCALKTVAAVSHQFFNAVTAGALVGAQPAFGDLSGTATTAQLPVVDVTHGGTALATLAIHQLYVGNGTSAPTAIAAGSNGQVLESAGGSADPAFQDPIVSGPDAVAATPTKNPVQVGCVFLTTPATLTNNQVGELECDASQNLLAKINAALPAGTNVIGHVIADSGSTTAVTGTVAVSAASLPLPTGAATAAKQPALGTAGSASADVISIQGVASMTAVKVDGSGVTQPVSGTITANQGTSPWVVSCTAGNCTVEVADGSGNKITTNSSTYTAKFAFDTNLLGTLGTAFSTAGKVDVKGADGDVFVRQATGTNLHMVCDSGCSSSAGFADSGAFTPGTTAINPVGGDFDDTPPTAITTGHAAAARITPNRAIHINLRNQAGTEIGTSSNPVRTDPTGTTTQPISAASLPLPTGAAADSSLTTIDTDLKANITLHSGAALIGKAGFDGTTPGNTNGVTQFQPARTTGTITTSSTSIPVATTGYGVATVTVNGTYAGVTANFEFSDDGGTTYYTNTCTRTDTNVQEVSEVLPSNQTRAWDCSLFGTTNFRVRSSAFTSGTANIGITLSAAPIEAAPTVSIFGTVPVSGTFWQATQPVSGTFFQATQPVSCATGATCPTNATLSAETTKVIGTVRAQGNLGAAFDAATGAAVPANAVMSGLKDTAGNTQDALSDTNGRQILKVYPDTTTTSYRASKKFAASSTTDNAVMPGNATNTVLVTKVLVTCNQTTAGQINVELLKRSVADTVGTSAAMTAVPMDSNYAAAVSAPLSYTGTGPTVGTAIGDLDNLQIGCMAPGTATPNDIFIFHPDKPIILRGVAQQIAVNVGNAALTGGNITVTFEWLETTTP